MCFRERPSSTRRDDPCGASSRETIARREALTLDRPRGDGNVIAVGNGTLRVYATPGHTRDMLCFADPVSQQVVVGDTLFAGGPGRPWSPADCRTTLHTLHEIVLR